MLVNKFYRQGKCTVLSQLDSLVHEESRYLVLSNILDNMCSLIKVGHDMAYIEHELIELLRRDYKKSWFSFAWQYEQTIQQDMFCLTRFLNWLGNDFKVLEVNKIVSAPVDSPLADQTTSLDTKVSLIVEFKNGRFGAVLLFFKTADKSLKGKSVHTSIATDLNAMVAKYALEKQYPGICISSVYLLSEDDSPDSMLPKLRTCDTRKSNVFSQNFEGYYENNVFLYDYFLEVLNNVRKQPFESSCYDCSKKYLCNVKALDTRTIQNVPAHQESVYELPNYSPSQKEVIAHVDGPLRVCAGPGSGKTATLVGRIKALMDNGVPPELILVITFTNEAAGELRERSRAFCHEGESPKISTINALGYEILQQNQSLFEHEISLLTQVQQMQLVKSLLSVTPQLSGISYAKEEGRNGLYKTVCGKLNKYMACESPEAFFLKEPKLGTDFVVFAEQYRAILKERGCISFDEQVTLCNDLFGKHPDILAIYQHLYRYVMVDEYQDINADQAQFIYRIAAHGNLVVVGDDDQSVYGFRGASNQYMIDFPKVFPGAKSLVLQDNFRSTQVLVDAASELISNNRIRIHKDIHCVKQGGQVPIVVMDSSAKAVVAIAGKCMQEGFSFGDIAVLSTKNAPLESLQKQLSIPCVLARSFLRNDALFLIIYDALKLHQDLNNNPVMYHFMCLFGVSVSACKEESLYQTCLRQGYPDVYNNAGYDISRENDNIYRMLRLLSNIFFLLDNEKELSTAVLLNNIAYYTGMESTTSYVAMEEMIGEQHLTSIDKLLDYMDYMVQFEDEKRVEVADTDSVLLITSHESKGREFPVVLMLDDYGETSEETRRLFYVAMTRAKERLYILHDSSCKNHFLEELSTYEKMEVL